MDITQIVERAHFDPDVYLSSNPDVAAAGVDPTEHWHMFGRREEALGTRPHWRAPLFDEAFYRAIYPDADALVTGGEFASAAEHWFAKGRREYNSGLRKAPDDFIAAEYLRARPDVARSIEQGAFDSAYDHWLRCGRNDAGLRNVHALDARRSRMQPRLLTPEKRAFWEDNGYLVLEGFLSAERCDEISAVVDRAWTTRAQGHLPVAIDILTREPGAQRIRFRDAPDDARGGTYKLNDMVLFDDCLRAACLDPDLCDVLRWIIGDDPVAIGSLNFERGSTQDFHTDTLFMPGRTTDSMTASWLALETVTTEAGPLIYYPGSHRIPLFKFSNGAPHMVVAEMPDYEAHMSSWVAALGLRPQAFLPNKGDLLIWHERLFHGGTTIEDMALTRKSMVVHYWRREHVESVKPAHGGFTLDRPPM